MERYYSKADYTADIEAEINRQEAKLREHKTGLVPLVILTVIVWIVCGVIGLLGNAGFTFFLILISAVCIGGRIWVSKYKQKKIDRLYDEYEKNKG
jgi:heme/copper-type cytochrome/quinol oxidase subunit 4